MSLKTVLYVEDSEADALFLQRGFKAAGIGDRLHVVRSAEEGQAWLSRPVPLPALVILDLKLVGLSGLDLLRWLKERPILRRIPVVILSSSGLPGDVEQAYDLGASSYLSKPGTLEGYKEIALLIARYWLGLNHVPADAAFKI